MGKTRDKQKKKKNRGNNLIPKINDRHKKSLMWPSQKERKVEIC